MGYRKNHRKQRKKNQKNKIFEKNHELVQHLKYLCLFACIIFEDQESIDLAVKFERLFDTHHKIQPYLIRDDNEYTKNMELLITPWQSVGAKGVVTLASKLMLALLPPQTSFFKLQADEAAIGEIDPQIRTEMDVSFAKIERTIMEAVAASHDRVTVHQAIKHLVVSGNALMTIGESQQLQKTINMANGSLGKSKEMLNKIRRPLSNGVLDFLSVGCVP